MHSVAQAPRSVLILKSLLHPWPLLLSNAFGAKYPPNLREQHPLIIIAGYTGQHGKQKYCVKGPITEGQR